MEISSRKPSPLADEGSLSLGAGSSAIHGTLVLDNVRKVHDTAARPVTALDGVSLEVEAGGFIAIMGPSGSDKSTLLQVAAGLSPDPPMNLMASG